MVECVFACVQCIVALLVLTLYWNRKRPQKRLKRSVVSRERLTAVALDMLITTGMQLYNVYIHAAKPHRRRAEERTRDTTETSQGTNTIQTIKLRN